MTTRPISTGAAVVMTASVLVSAAPARAATAAGPVLAGAEAAEVRTTGSLASRLVVGSVAWTFGRIAPEDRVDVEVLDLAASAQRTALVRRVSITAPPQAPCRPAPEVCSSSSGLPSTPRSYEAWSAPFGQRPRLLVRRSSRDGCAGRLVPVRVEVSGDTAVLLESQPEIYCASQDERSRIVAVDRHGTRRVITAGTAEHGAPLDFVVDGDWVAWRTDGRDGRITVARLSTGKVVYRAPPRLVYDVDADGRLALLAGARTRYPCGPDLPVSSDRVLIADPHHPRPRAIDLRSGNDSALLAISRGRILVARPRGRCLLRSELVARDVVTGVNRFVPPTCATSFLTDLHSAFDGRRLALACGVVVPQRRAAGRGRRGSRWSAGAQAAAAGARTGRLP